MVVLFPAVRRVNNPLYRRQTIRVFHSFSPCQAARKSASTSAKRTVKAFAELPSVFLRPDGNIATPLGKWQGGLDKILSTSVDCRSRAEACGSRDNIQKSAEALALSNNPRGRTSRRIQKVNESEQPTDNTLPQNKTNRGGKTKQRPSSKPETASFLTSNQSPAVVKRSPDNPHSIDLPSPGEKCIPPSLEDIGLARPRNALAREIFDNLSKFPHCLLLTKVGQFYESYFDQAIELSRLLKIKLTTRKWDNHRVPMCGFPLVHLDKHLKVLVQQNKRFVAMCEEFPRSSSLGTKEFERRVVRVVTPGTLIDEPFLNPYENNYLLAVSIPEFSEPTRDVSSVGLAWIDVSTGEFFAKVTTLDEIQDELARISPREVVLDKRMESIKDHPVFRALAEDNNFISYITPPSFTTTEREVSPTPSATPWADVDYPKYTDTSEASAITLLTSYLSANLLDHMPFLSSPRREGSKPHMEIDSHTIKALEIRERVWEGGTKGSLLAIMKRTLTYGGSRLLARWLCSPSTSIVEINARQSLVAFFHARPHFHADIAALVAEVEDTKRITQKLILGRGNVGDLLAVNKTIRAWTNIFNRISEEREMEVREWNEYNPSDWGSLDALMSRMIGLEELSKRIGTALGDVTKSEYQMASENEHSLIEESEATLNDDAINGFWRPGNGKWIIKPQFSAKLETLHVTLQDLVEKKKQLERHLQIQYDAPSLTLRASPSQGIHVHVTKSKRDQTKLLASPEFITIAESGSTRSFFYKEWSQLATTITETAISLSTAEKEAFETLRNEVSSHAPTLRYNSQVLDELDVALSFASVATEMNFIRPTLVEDSTVYDITNGRHPCVELGLLGAGRVFTPNSVQLSQKKKLQFITGPNMGGKSTLLRQTALIAILAQTGSFVPADSAFIGIVDKVFSRVGAKDDLFHDRSTFMVEMLETAQILRKATLKSLVIMDEVGRGTTTRDGIAIAFATLHHLVTKNKCRTLFATHFHELATMMGYPDNQTIFQSVDFFYTSVDETNDGHFAYSYRVQPGINRDSHGLKVAQLAGLPSAALNVAQEILSQMRGDGIQIHDIHNTVIKDSDD